MFLGLIRIRAFVVVRGCDGFVAMLKRGLTLKFVVVVVVGVFVFAALHVLVQSVLGYEGYLTQACQLIGGLCVCEKPYMETTNSMNFVLFPNLQMFVRNILHG